MKFMKYSLPLFWLLISQFIYCQTSPVEKGLNAITTDVIKAQTGFLASEWTEGRESGKKGEYLAGAYIASMLQLYGVRPMGDYISSTDQLKSPVHDLRTYFQNFIIIKAIPSEVPSLSIIDRSGEENRIIPVIYNVDFSVRPLYRSVQITAPVVFAGYGFRNEKIKFNDFSRIDIKGKFILRISGYPAFAEKSLTQSEINGSLRALENYARENGAAGIIEFDPASLVAGNPEPEEFMNMSPAERIREDEMERTRYYLPGKTMPDNLAWITVSARAADEILKGSGINISMYRKKADSNEEYEITAIINRSVSFRSDAILSQIPVRNIIGVIEGSEPDQALVIGAHYDHIGIHDGYIWNGADDNASGTAGTLTMAKALTATGKKPQKNIIIALWSSEEKGLLGSRYFVRNPVCPLNNIRMNLNFDMISRYISDENKNGVDMTYTSCHSRFRDITEENLKKFSIDLVVNYHPSDDPPGGSDHRSFAEAGIPIMRFKPGHRNEYHTPSDEVQTLDWDIMEKIIRISFLNIWELANSDW